MTSRVLTEHAESISAFKRNPMAALSRSQGAPLAVLNHNKAAFYCVPADQFEALMDRLDDLELAALVREREDEPTVAVSLDQL